MRRVSEILRAVSAVAFLVVVSASGDVADAADRIAGFETRTYALVGATVIPEPGVEIKDGIVVLHDGLIAAVGKRSELKPPADAKVIDAKGLYIYAGFIDAAASLPINVEKIPKPLPAKKVDFGRYVLAATRPDNRRLVTPAFTAWKAVPDEEKTFAGWRKLGFTAVHVFPRGRIASGTGSLISTGVDPIRERLLVEKTLSGLRLYSPGGSVYPSTLMGATAHLRQTLLDAARHATHRSLYAKRTRGVKRPVFDPQLRALGDVLAGKTPCVFEAKNRDDIERSLKFAREFKLSPLFFAGGDPRVATEMLAALKRPVILQATNPTAPRIERRKTGKLVEEQKDPLRVQWDALRNWHQQWHGWADLDRRGVPIALGSEGLDDKKRADVFAALRNAIAHGLPRNRALAAITTVPATLVGQQNRLGKLEKGMLAHAVVMTGPFDHSKSKVRHVFVDGKHFEFNEKAKPIEGKSPRTALVAPWPHSSTPPSAIKGEEATELLADRKHRPIQTGGNLLVRNANILTGAGKTLLNHDILIQKGKIVRIGKSLEAPAGIAVLKVEGKWVMPGMIDTHSHIMIDGGVNEYTQSVVPEVRIKDEVDTDDVSEWQAVAGGVTTARLLHGSANVVGGQDAVVKLKFGRNIAAHLLDKSPQGIKFALGENVKRRRTRFPNTRLGVEATLNRAFMEALDYRQKWMEYERARKAAPGVALPPRRDLRLEALSKILEREIFIHCHCYRADEILMLLRVADKLGFRIWSLQHVLEGYKIAPEIVKHGASCSTFSDWWAYKVEAFDATPFNAALLNEAGANVCIKSDSRELIRHMASEAAKPVRYGNVSPADALKMVTRNPARELGLQHRIGTLGVGRDGDLAIFNGHPFNSFARCEYTIIDGEVIWVRNAAPTVMSRAAKLRTPPKFFPRQHKPQKLDLATAKNHRYAIVNATLHPIDRPAIRKGVLLVADGKIEKLGSDVKVPAGYKTIDATGLHVYPGMIDSGTTLGIVEIGSLSETRDERESGELQPDLRAGVAVNPDSELIPAARAGGITLINTRPVGGTIGGQTSLVKLGGWTAPEMVVNLEHALQINWPRGSLKSTEKTRKKLDDFLNQAKLYLKIKNQSAANPARQPIPDPRFDALAPYLAGEKRVHIEAHSRDQIAQALLFCEKHKLKPVITGGTNAWKIAGELKKRKVPVIVGPVMRSPIRKHDPQDAPYANPGRLHEAGVKFCIRSDHASNSRNAPFEAAMAVAHGLPADVGIKSVTQSAAEILGISDKYGTLTPGKRASLIITTGNPLQITEQIRGIFIDGKPFAPQSRQTRFYHRYRERLLEWKSKQ